MATHARSIDHMHLQDGEAALIDRRAALGSLAAVAGALIVPGVAKAESPSKMSGLADEFDVAWALETAVYAAAGELDEDDPNSELSQASAASKAIAERIIAAPTRDLDDCKLKARVYLWCYDNDPEEALGMLHDRARTTDCKVLHVLMRDLLALDGKL